MQVIRSLDLWLLLAVAATTTTTTAAAAAAALAPGGSARLSPRAGPFANGTLLRIMPLGDSITLGTGSPNYNGYRKPLVAQLETELFANYSMVGTLNDGDFDDGTNRTRHQGHGGYFIDQIREVALQPDTVAAFRPNVVLLHAGTNDASKNLNTVTAAERLEQLIQDVFERASGDAVVVAATMIPAYKNTAIDGRITAMNADYRGMLARLVQEGRRIVVVDMGGPDGLDASEQAGNYKDSVHPNDKGYRVMADLWISGIRQAEQRGWIKEPDQIAAALALLHAE